MTRWIALRSAVLGSLLLCGCSAVGTPEPACRPLEVAEFPLLGGIRGTWMDDERFVRPIRFLLLSSAALRAGEVPSCD